MRYSLVLAVLMATGGAVFGASTAPSAFTYQGRLYSNGDLAD